MAKKKTSSIKLEKTTGEKDFLLKELKSLLPKLDSEGLAFLIEQSRIHLYNMQVTELNKAEIAAFNTSQKRKGAAPRAVTQSKAEDKSIRIEGTESGSSYYLYYGSNNSVMFSRDEMRLLIKLVNAEGTDLEIRTWLYSWFERERKDIFAILPLKDKFDERLKFLVKYIRENFKLK